MARHFGVSARTVYRWVEALSMADVPVYAEKGKGGGIRISENYAIDKAVLTEREKLDVLAGTFSQAGKPCRAPQEHFPRRENLAALRGRLSTIICSPPSSTVRSYQGVCDTPLQFLAKYKI